MKLYEINAEIMRCYMEAVNNETGEIEEERLDADKLQELEMAKEMKIENICKWYKNLKAEEDALKSEITRLTDRKKKAGRKADSLAKYVESVLQGEKFKSQDGVVAVTWRKSKKTQVCEGYTEAEVIKIMQESDRDDLLTYKQPALNLTAIKDAILKDGEFLPGVEVIENNSMSIK